MTFPQRRILGWTVLLVFAAGAAIWLGRLDYTQKVSTDVLDLIPAGEREPELAMVRALASDAEARTMLFVLTDQTGGPAPLAAAQRFAGAIGKAPQFRQALALGDPGWRDAVGHELFRRRMALLFPFWVRQFNGSAGGTPGVSPDGALAQAAQRLQAFIGSPEGLAFQDLVTADPLLLLPDALARMKDGLAAMQPDSRATQGLVWAQLSVSPLREEGQAPVFAAIEQARGMLAPEFAGVQVAFTGVNRFAAASRARIEREVTWLNTLSVVAVLGVAVVFIRRVFRALHLVPVIAFSTLGAWVATTVLFDRIHVIVFVLGALLTGVAIDYGFYLYMQPPLVPGEDYWKKVRRLAKPLLASCLTTVFGFALLLWSDLPMIRHLGVFVGAGLIAALAAAVLYFLTVRDPFLEPRAWVGAPRRGPAWRARLRWAFLALWAVALAGLPRLTWRDDIRELEVPARGIQADDARIRAAFGASSASTVYLTHGATLAAARAAADGLASWLQSQGVGSASLIPVVPTRVEFDAAVKFVRGHPELPRRLLEALGAAGFAETEFSVFADAYAQFARDPGDWEAAVEGLRSRLSGPLALLVHSGNGQHWFVTLVQRAPAATPPPETHSVTASQLQSLNRLFTQYRASALRLSLAGLALVGLGVFLTYGWRDGARIFAIPCGACLGVFGVFGWLGVPLNLFHLLGAFLGVCLTHNYSIFSATSAYRLEPPPVSVRLSALTTAASFGVLAGSSIPVVRALGLTVAVMVVAALVAIELEHLSPLGKKT